ncbi:MAG: Zn-ribbon domain-containing OB-fold protein [Desulfohalobiaceae bacterium]|nr:Zn-ribbon domain-containing OB-fold protein [Desulfohalobiaceae bacterium]
MEYKLPFRDYHKALLKNRLLGLKCNQCGRVTCPPQMSCSSCSSYDLEITQLSGKGKITTFTTIVVAPEGRETEAPYIIVVVELEEGPWIMGNLTDMDPGRAGMDLIGKTVEAGCRVFPGDRYSDGPMARPAFRFAAHP